MTVILEGENRADEGEPDKKVPAHLFGKGQPAVKSVAEHDIGRDHDDHAEQERGQHELDQPDDGFDGPSHERGVPSMPKIAHCACSGLLP
jgi:hypothetical protein